MAELLRVTRDKDEAFIRHDWLEEWAGHGWVPEGQPVTQTDEFTREGIAAMDKADVLDLLDLHGWNGDKRLGVDKLRDALVAIMFVGDE